MKRNEKNRIESNKRFSDTASSRILTKDRWNCNPLLYHWAKEATWTQGIIKIHTLVYFLHLLGHFDEHRRINSLAFLFHIIWVACISDLDTVPKMSIQCLACVEKTLSTFGIVPPFGILSDSWAHAMGFQIRNEVTWVSQTQLRCLKRQPLGICLR